tara:strand:+ start:34 stop:429 length:396 start_codon:yes stop_codon:yes gene_type:complete
MAKIKRSILNDIKKAAREIKNKEIKENNSASKFKKKLTAGDKRQIRKDSLNDHRVKVTWNIHPGDLVKIKGRVSPTGKEIFGLVTWGIKETIQKAPYLGYQKDITSYESQIRVMSSAGYRFFPANSMIVIS